MYTVVDKFNWHHVSVDIYVVFDIYIIIDIKAVLCIYLENHDLYIHN